MQESSKALILASSSSYRRLLLERLQLPFKAIAPSVDETFKPEESPQASAVRLSIEKARAVSEDFPDALVLGSDQVAALGDQRLHKPGTPSNARAQLEASSGRTVEFHTGVALVQNGHLLEVSCVKTLVKFRELSAREINDYVTREQALDCAGSFRWEALGISLFVSLQSDDPTALEGLPLITVCNMLRRLEYHIP